VKDNDNLDDRTPDVLTHLECAMEGDHYPADRSINLSESGQADCWCAYDHRGVKKRWSQGRA